MFSPAFYYCVMTERRIDLVLAQFFANQRKRLESKNSPTLKDSRVTRDFPLYLSLIFCIYITHTQLNTHTHTPFGLERTPHGGTEYACERKHTHTHCVYRSSLCESHQRLRLAQKNATTGGNDSLATDDQPVEKRRPRRHSATTQVW